MKTDPSKATISTIYRTIGSMTKLNTLLLDEVPITDTLQDVFNNQNLKYLTLRRPRKRFYKIQQSKRLATYFMFRGSDCSMSHLFINL